MDRFIDAQMVEIDEPKRLSILKKIHALDHEGPLSIPLFGLKMIYATRPMFLII